MQRILIGSSAIKHHFPDFSRNPKDVDYIGEGKNILGKIEFHKNPIFDNYEHEIMLPNDLYTLKFSHIFWDINWSKHMYDIQFLKEKGCVLQKDLFNKLYAYWNTLHGVNKRSDLEMTSESFFDNYVKSEHDHDFLHTLINPYPTFNKVLKDNEEVAVDENKFHKLSFEEKLDLVREEIYIMAYERLNNRDYRVAYSWMLKKFIQHHAPLWEAIFIVENYKILHKPLFNYKQHLDYELQRIIETN